MPMPGDQHRDTPATTNPFVEQKPKVTEYTAQEIATLQSRLEKQLGPEYISTRPGAGGGKVHYLAAEKVINLANEVFGFNGWSSEIKNVQIDFVDESPSSGKITLGLSTIVRVTLRDGTFHEDIGYGHIENCKGKAAAFEKAKKEAATDAMKRALRNFGNVLGNCLYDKDYLQKVTKVKVAPSKWDAENLHRHPDFAPIKREAIADVGVKEEKEKASAAQRQTSAQSNVSFGSMEFEDEFGGLDDTDFSHPDEVRLEDAATSANISAKKALAVPPANGGLQQQGVPRMQSMPQMRPPNIQPPPAVHNLQAPPRPQGPPRPPNNVAQVPPNRPHPPQAASNQQRPGQPAPVLAQAHTDAGTKSNPSSGTPTDASTTNNQQNRQSIAQNHPNGDQLDDKGLPIPRAPPPGIPEGFVTGRGVDLLNQPPSSRPPNAALAFNPHADSPSIRRTHGINPGKSAPVTRSAITGATTAANGPQAGGAAQQTNGLNGAAAPVRTNFVNPAADVNRRIGMPPSAAAHSIQNRGFKPQTPMKRPPLSDVSNIPPQVDGASEAKKPKLVEQQQGSEGVGGGAEQDAPAAT